MQNNVVQKKTPHKTARRPVYFNGYYLLCDCKLALVLDHLPFGANSILDLHLELVISGSQ